MKLHDWLQEFFFFVHNGPLTNDMHFLTATRWITNVLEQPSPMAPPRPTVLLKYMLY
ncbi:hypothetical protein JG687_00019121 [Phytophthora cactorum]|uniref:Uncharacterized protein n=1 Tax=Phytophthora cactorum TaxID=29920 RepID=A0A8T1TM25_9STRA|nr:hypothetical protein JG687_00019121 [Phytophthora cactorum]